MQAGQAYKGATRPRVIMDTVRRQPAVLTHIGYLGQYNPSNTNVKKLSSTLKISDLIDGDPGDTP